MISNSYPINKIFNQSKILVNKISINPINIINTINTILFYCIIIINYISTFCIILYLSLCLIKLFKLSNPIEKFIKKTVIYLLNKTTENKTCNICYDTVSKYLALKNDCDCKDKVYHVYCIYKWKFVCNSCPYCRKELNLDFIIN